MNFHKSSFHIRCFAFYNPMGIKQKLIRFIENNVVEMSWSMHTGYLCTRIVWDGVPNGRKYVRKANRNDLSFSYRQLNNVVLLFLCRRPRRFCTNNLLINNRNTITLYYTIVQLTYVHKNLWQSLNILDI